MLLNELAQRQQAFGCSAWRMALRLLRNFKFSRAMKISVFLATVFGLMFVAHSMWGAEAAKKTAKKGPRVTKQVKRHFRFFNQLTEDK